MGDIHLPYHSKRAVEDALAYIKFVKPDIVVQLGDLADCLSWGRFPRSLNGLTPKQEWSLARRQAIELWQKIRSAAGKDCELYQLLGNHCERPLKQILSKAPEYEHMIAEEMGRFFSFDGVTTMPSENKELIIDGCVYMHGHRKHGSHVTYNLKSTTVGHLHLGGVVYLRLDKRTVWELNAGYLGQPREMGGYRKQTEIDKWTAGIGHTDDFGPRFVAFK